MQILENRLVKEFTGNEFLCRTQAINFITGKLKNRHLKDIRIQGQPPKDHSVLSYRTVLKNYIPSVVILL